MRLFNSLRELTPPVRWIGLGNLGDQVRWDYDVTPLAYGPRVKHYLALAPIFWQGRRRWIGIEKWIKWTRVW